MVAMPKVAAVVIALASAGFHRVTTTSKIRSANRSSRSCIRDVHAVCWVHVFASGSTGLSVSKRPMYLPLSRKVWLTRCWTCLLLTVRNPTYSAVCEDPVWPSQVTLLGHWRVQNLTFCVAYLPPHHVVPFRIQQQVTSFYFERCMQGIFD